MVLALYGVTYTSGVALGVFVITFLVEASAQLNETCPLNFILLKSFASSLVPLIVLTLYFVLNSIIVPGFISNVSSELSSELAYVFFLLLCLYDL